MIYIWNVISFVLWAYNRQLPIKQLNEKGQKDKQQSTKHVHKTEDRGKEGTF